jgi:hypothetical protein
MYWKPSGQPDSIGERGLSLIFNSSKIQYLLEGAALLIKAAPYLKRVVRLKR